jgi:hypothetical protein
MIVGYLLGRNSSVPTKHLSNCHDVVFEVGMGAKVEVLLFTKIAAHFCVCLRRAEKWWWWWVVRLAVGEEYLFALRWWWDGRHVNLIVEGGLDELIQKLYARSKSMGGDD